MTHNNSTIIHLSKEEIEALNEAVDILNDLYVILPPDSVSMHFTDDELEVARDIVALLAEFGEEIAFEAES